MHLKKIKDTSAVPYSEIVKKKLRDLGYGVHAQVVDFSHYGVPQRRKRFIMVGVLGGNESDAEFAARLNEREVKIKTEQNKKLNEVLDFVRTTPLDSLTAR